MDFVLLIIVEWFVFFDMDNILPTGFDLVKQGVSAESSDVVFGVLRSVSCYCFYFLFRLRAVVAHSMVGDLSPASIYLLASGSRYTNRFSVSYFFAARSPHFIWGARLWRGVFNQGLIFYTFERKRPRSGKGINLSESPA